MLTVIKFGGSSLSTAEKIYNAARIAAEHKKQGKDVVMVVSARGKTTDALVREAEEISRTPDPRELDVLLSTGEQASMALVAMALIAMGVPAVSLCGWQAGILTEDKHNRAKIISIHTERIRQELKSGRVVVAAGFQGMDSNGDITTIGRGGSDTSAVALAAALGAEECLIYTDVDGVYSADPNVVQGAFRHTSLSCDEMLEMASLGAGVLHNRSVELAKSKAVNLKVLSSSDSSGGTGIVPLPMEGSRVSGVMCDKNTALVEMFSYGDGNLPEVLELLAASSISADMIISHGSRIGLTVPRSQVKAALKLLLDNGEKLSVTSACTDTNIAKLSIVGCGLCSDGSVASRMLSALKNHGVQVRSMVCAEIKISVLIPLSDAIDAVKCVHDVFFPQ
ncbi:MAG: aspartate kinase [Clostridia bacterium]|nr:aspartate kinase [Clostridia bacterium]